MAHAGIGYAGYRYPVPRRRERRIRLTTMEEILQAAGATVFLLREEREESDKKTIDHDEDGTKTE